MVVVAVRNFLRRLEKLDVYCHGMSSLIRCKQVSLNAYICENACGWRMGMAFWLSCERMTEGEKDIVVPSSSVAFCARASTQSPNAHLTKSKFLSQVPKTRRFQPSPALHIRYFICSYSLPANSLSNQRIHNANLHLLLKYIAPKSSG